MSSSNYQQLQQATKRRNNGLFFIKSKHARPNFKNHSYFQKKPPGVDSQRTRHATIEDAQAFVDYPSGYGIDNTFNYLCDQIRLSKLKASIFRQVKPVQINVGRLQGEERKRVASEILLHQDSQHAEELPAVQHSMRVNTEPTRKYLQTTQSFNYRIRTFNSQAKPQRYQGQSGSLGPASHVVQMVYMSGQEKMEEVISAQENQHRISFNLLPYVVNCFLKCKVNYSNNMTQAHLQTIKKCIEEVKMSTKSYFDVKDVVNLCSLSEVMAMLQHYGQGSLEWIQTARYFFMPNEQVLDYQFQKAVDQIRAMSALKFGASLTNKTVFIYRMEDKVRITNLYDMLKPGTYVYSENKLVYQIYSNVLKRRMELTSYHNRIRKWRSMVPMDENRTQGSRKSQNEEQSKSKINRLFRLTKQRRTKTQSRKPSRQNSGILITSQNNCSSFVDRSKLHTSEDIFE